MSTINRINEENKTNVGESQRQKRNPSELKELFDQVIGQSQHILVEKEVYKGGKKSVLDSSIRRVESFKAIMNEDTLILGYGSKILPIGRSLDSYVQRNGDTVSVVLWSESDKMPDKKTMRRFTSIPIR